MRSRSRRLGSSATTTAASGAATSICSDTSAWRRLAKNRRNIVLRRRTSKTQVAVIVGVDIAAAGTVPSAIRPSSPSGASNRSYRSRDPSSKGPTGAARNPSRMSTSRSNPFSPSP
jgi:hypothetical protein